MGGLLTEGQADSRTRLGFAGAVSALNAAQAGAKTLLLEKSSVPGGLSVCSYGAVRSARNPDEAFAYLKATNAGRTPDDVVRALAQGVCEVERYVRELGEINNAKITTSLEEAAVKKRRRGQRIKCPVDCSWVDHEISQRLHSGLARQVL